MGPTLVVWNVQMLRLVPHTGFILSSRDHRKQTNEILLPEQRRAREDLGASETKNHLGVSLRQKCSGGQIRVHSALPQKSFSSCVHSCSGIRYPHLSLSRWSPHLSSILPSVLALVPDIYVNEARVLSL